VTSIQALSLTDI